MTIDIFRKDLIVEILHMGEGVETFITAVSGRITVERLQEIEKQMADGEAFDKGAGSYVFDCAYFPGQYGEFGYCELPPCWDMTPIGFVSLEQLALKRAGRPKMTDFLMHSMDDASRLFCLLQAQDFTRPKKIVIKDQDRSGEQNKKLHACLSDIAKQVEHAGKKWDVLIWKRLLTAAWLRESGEQPQLIPAVDGNGFDVVYERTSQLSVKQCASLLEWIQAFGAEHQVRWSQKDLWEGRY